MINWHLSKQGIRWPVSHDCIAGWSLQLIEVKCSFEVDCWPSASFSIGLRAHVWLTYWKQGRIVRKPVNTNFGLNVNQIVTFSSFQMFLLLCFVYIWWLLKLKTEGQTIYIVYRLLNSNQSSTFSWVSVSRLPNNPELTRHEPGIQSKTSTCPAVNFKKTLELDKL